MTLKDKQELVRLLGLYYSDNDKNLKGSRE